MVSTLAALFSAGTLLLPTGALASDKLLNASYDVARNVYRDLNPAFAEAWKKDGGGTIKIDQSHGGSTKQARSVIDGLEADVVTMNNPLDIDVIAERGKLLPKNWATLLPHNASPSWSTILFLVRKGNPKGIKDWDDLVKPGVAVILPNPKTSGNGRYSYLAAWEFAKRKADGKDEAGAAFVKKLLGNVPILDTGGRGATTTFSQREIGDVLLTFENEVTLIRQELGDKFEVVVPSLTVRADNPVAVVQKYADKHGNAKLARAYLEFHYTPEGQAIFAKNALRPSDPAVLAQYASTFPALNVFTVESAFGSWPKAQADHFADGGSFDKIYSAR
ncbi:thiosulfate transporter subunit [Panacagrimonas perspica]|nr:thiosulfate transporter subunit [Panacagrimonas perspica]